MKILICDKLDKQTLEELQKIGNCIDTSEEKNKKEKIIENIVDAEIVLVRSDTQINKELIDISKNLKIIGRSGVGTDNIDLIEVSARNIHVTNTPEANVISSYYLSKTFSQDKIFYSTELSDKEIFHINKNKYDFIFLSPRHLNKLGDQSIDFVINTRSMMEMNYTTINYYFNSIKRIIKNEGFFYLVNRYQKISFLKNYPFGQKWEIVLSKNWPTYIDTNPCHELLLKRTDNYNNELIELLNTFPPYGFTNIKHKIKKYLVDKKIIKHWRGKVA